MHFNPKVLVVTLHFMVGTSGESLSSEAGIVASLSSASATDVEGFGSVPFLSGWNRGYKRVSQSLTLIPNFFLLFDSRIFTCEHN